MMRLHSGGFIATYRCTAACKHCLYASSPKREVKYVTRDIARESLSILRGHGCTSLHIGGGEPLLDVEGLCALMNEMDRAGVRVDYVETNGFWAKGDRRDIELIGRLKDNGMKIMMLSLCPFHMEYVPMKSVMSAVDACERAGVQVFVWQEKFAKKIERTGDTGKPHTLAEYEAANPGGVALLPEQFGLRLGGRASVYYEDTRAQTPLDELLKYSTPCYDMLNTGHFHVDCFGDITMAGCTGIGYPLRDLDRLTGESAPATAALNEGGCSLLTRIAMREGFHPRENYIDVCALCQHARAYLQITQGDKWPDLRPRGFYTELYAEAKTGDVC